MITSGLSFNVFNMSEAATNPLNFCVRLIKISILYLSPVVSAGFFVCFSWRGYSSPERNPHWLKCQCQAAAKRAIRSILSANCTPPCGCRTRSTGFPSASSNLDPFDTVALSRTHPTPSETTTHPDRLMKRFKKKDPKPTPQKTSIIQLPHPASTAQTKSPANNTHIQTSKPMIKINDTADRPSPRYLSMKCT